MKELVDLLNRQGIRAGEAYPGGDWMGLTEPVAGVSLRDLDYSGGNVTFEIRILSPRGLGGWCCQGKAVEVCIALEQEGLDCSLERMEYQKGIDCYEMAILARKQITEEAVQENQEVSIWIGGEAVAYVTEFSATQNRNRRLIGAMEQATPVGITPGSGGWEIRMVQVLPRGVGEPAEPEEPFQLILKEAEAQTVFSGCGWNKRQMQVSEEQRKIIWEGFALTREERADG